MTTLKETVYSISHQERSQYMQAPNSVDSVCEVAPQPIPTRNSSISYIKKQLQTLTSMGFSKPVLGILLMFIGLGLYPISDACIKHLLGSYSVYQTTFVRAFSRLIPLLFFAVMKTGSFSLLKTSQPRRHALRLLVSVISTYSFMYACSVTSLTSMYTLSYTSPIFMLIFSALLLHEKVDKSRWIAVLVGFCGILIALKPSEGEVFQLGASVVLLGTLCAALNKILMRKLSITDDSLTISMYPNIAIVCVTAPFLFGSWVSMPLEHWALFGCVGIITALAQYCVAQALRFTEASRLAPIDYSTLFWATAIDFVRWDSLPHMSTLAGAFIIIMSNLYILRKTQRN